MTAASGAAPSMHAIVRHRARAHAYYWLHETPIPTFVLGSMSEQLCLLTRLPGVAEQREFWNEKPGVSKLEFRGT